MDINANFDEICELYNAKWKNGIDEDQQDRLVELIEAGLNWLKQGGFLPRKMADLPRPMVIMIYEWLMRDNKANW